MPPAVEPCAQARQVAGRRSAHRRKPLLHAGNDELVEALRRLDVLEQMLAEVADLGVVADEVARRPREQHLAAVCRRTDACGARQVDTDVVAPLGQRRLAGMNADPHTDIAAGQRSLGCGGRGNGVVRASERDEERVALRVDLEAVVLDERLTEHAPVRRQHVAVPVAEAAGELGRPFDVREEEGDGSGGEAGHDPADGPQLSRL